MSDYMRTLRENVYKKAVEKWGFQNQMIVALEEFSELQVEIAKHLNNKRPDISGLIDELADARIMIEQMELNFNCADLVEARMHIKIAKLTNIINRAEVEINKER